MKKSRITIRSGKLIDCGGHRCLVRLYVNRSHPEPSEKLSLGFARRWFGYESDGFELIVWLLGLRLHWQRSSGGQFGAGRTA